eukprot:7384363-Prymnesium_polylepis.2
MGGGWNRQAREVRQAREIRQARDTASESFGCASYSELRSDMPRRNSACTGSVWITYRRACQLR